MKSHNMYHNVWKRIVICILCAVLLVPAAGSFEGTHTAAAAQSKKNNKKKKKSDILILTKDDVHLEVGGTCRIRVKKTKLPVKWSISDRSVVRIRVFNNRTIMAYGEDIGTATVTAKVGGKKLRCTITVTDPIAEAEENMHWSDGTWKEECFYNGTGILMADLQAAMTQEVPKRAFLGKYPYLYIGASRTKNTARAVKDKKVYFYYCSGAGFRWFFLPIVRRTRTVVPALQMIRSYLEERPSGTVIIDLGGNDLTNIAAYIGFYRSLMNYYPCANFRFMGILPRAKGDPSNPARKAFNVRMSEEFPGQVIDLFDKVYHMSGFKTVDGVHYGKPLSRKVYKLVMNRLGRKIKINSKNGKVTG